MIGTFDDGMNGRTLRRLFILVCFYSFLRHYKRTSHSFDSSLSDRSSALEHVLRQRLDVTVKTVTY